MARRLAIRVKSISEKLRKESSRERYASKHFLKNKSAEKYLQFGVFLDTKGVKSEGTTTMHRQRIFPALVGVEGKSRVN